MIKVCQRPELIQALEHGLTFADDLTVNNALLTKYSLWEYLTPCDADNVNILNACIQRWRDEANKLFETTLFAYDPTRNYNIEEKGKDERTPDLTDERSPDLTDEISYNSTVTGAETGYDVPRTFEDTTKTTNGGKDTTTHKGKETLTKKGKETTEHGRTRAGTIGATQDLIAKERQIIVDCVSWYVEKFKQCFTVSLDITDYCCECEPLPFAPCPDRESEELSEIKQDIRNLKTDVAELETTEAVQDHKIDDLTGDVATLGNDVLNIQGDIVTINNTLATKAPLMFGSLHGNNLHITDCAGAPIINCILTFAADQAGSGDPSPSNPRTISGLSRADVWVTPDDGGPYMVYASDWSGVAGTIYGGTLNIDTGELVVTWAAVDMGSLSWVVSSSNNHIYRVSIPGRFYAINAQCLSEIYYYYGNGTSTELVNNLKNNQFGGYIGSRNIVVRDDRFTNDAVAFTAAVTGYKLIYMLENPLTYTITAARPVLVNGGCTVEEINSPNTIIDGSYLMNDYELLAVLLSY